MYTFIIIFAVALVLSFYFTLKPSSTQPEITPSESVLEEPIAVENPTVVVENDYVDVKSTKKNNRKKFTKGNPFYFVR